MIDTTKISKQWLNSMAQALGWEPENFEHPTEAIPEEYLKQIGNMSREEAFEKWCSWNGFLGWSGTFMAVVDELDLAEFTLGRV